jgi:preprotein translocase subunit YajC
MIPYESILGGVLGTASGPPPLAGASGNAVVPAGPGEAAATGDAAAAPPAGLGFEPMFLLLVVIGGMIIFSMFSSRKQKKQREQMLSAIGKSDRVQTIGGIIGSVIEVKSDTVVVQIDDGNKVRMTFSRSAIQQVLEKHESNSDD